MFVSLCEKERKNSLALTGKVFFAFYFFPDEKFNSVGCRCCLTLFPVVVAAVAAAVATAVAGGGGVADAGVAGVSHNQTPKLFSPSCFSDFAHFSKQNWAWKSLGLNNLP